MVRRIVAFGVDVVLTTAVVAIAFVSLARSTEVPSYLHNACDVRRASVPRSPTAYRSGTPSTHSRAANVATVWHAGLAVSVANLVLLQGGRPAAPSGSTRSALRVVDANGQECGFGRARGAVVAARRGRVLLLPRRADHRGSSTAGHRPRRRSRRQDVRGVERAAISASRYTFLSARRTRRARLSISARRRRAAASSAASCRTVPAFIRIRWPSSQAVALRSRGDPRPASVELGADHQPEAAHVDDRRGRSRRSSRSPARSCSPRALTLVEEAGSRSARRWWRAPPRTRSGCRRRCRRAMPVGQLAIELGRRAEGRDREARRDALGHAR